MTERIVNDRNLPSHDVVFFVNQPSLTVAETVDVVEFTTEREMTESQRIYRHQTFPKTVNAELEELVDATVKPFVVGLETGEPMFMCGTTHR